MRLHTTVNKKLAAQFSCGPATKTSAFTLPKASFVERFEGATGQSFCPIFGFRFQIYRLRLRIVQAKPISGDLYAMTRGRCSALIGRGGQPRWGLFHGNDFPSKLNVDAQKQRLVSTFGLRDATRMGLVSFQFDDHERMIPDDQRRLQRLLGVSIPY